MKSNIKSFVAGCLATVATAGLIGTSAATVGAKTVQADYNNIKVTLDGKPVSLVDAAGNAVEPFAVDGTTYLPIRAVASALGLDVSWDGKTNTAVLTTPTTGSAGASETTGTTEPTGRTVYITKTGSKYHYDSTCNGGTYWAVPYETAIQKGLTPCSKCVGSTSASVDTDTEAQAYAVVNDNVPFFQQVS